VIDHTERLIFLFLCYYCSLSVQSVVSHGRLVTYTNKGSIRIMRRKCSVGFRTFAVLNYWIWSCSLSGEWLLLLLYIHPQSHYSSNPFHNITNLNPGGTKETTQDFYQFFHQLYHQLTIMCEIKIWCRKCIVCQRVDEIEHSKHQDGCGSCDVIRTTLPDQSLQGANENYRCRGCRSRQAYESHQLNNQIMEAREDNKYGYSR
jgi:hypothetical protein